MNSILCLDIGAGTMDILYSEKAGTRQYKAVVCSPLQTIARQIEGLTGDILVHGVEMGGGQVSRVLKERAQRSRVVMTNSAAATIHHDLGRVAASGIETVPDTCYLSKLEEQPWNVVRSGDIEHSRIEKIMESFGVGTEADIVAVCAQDHGAAPAGTSHLDFRQRLFSRQLKEIPRPEQLLYTRSDIPPEMTRLQALAQTASHLAKYETYVMDSGMAAVLGACLDERARAGTNLIVMDVATSHTLVAAVREEELLGFVEYHTSDITAAVIRNTVRRLADGAITHEQVLRDGGHGAWIRGFFGFDCIDAIIATGPRRSMIADCGLPLIMGAPFGDNMLTGAAGLLEAVRRRKGWPPFSVT